MSQLKFSLCNLCVLYVSVVLGLHDTLTTETQRTQRLHREDLYTTKYKERSTKYE
jgi:hypothetical protein